MAAVVSSSSKRRSLSKSATLALLIIVASILVAITVVVFRHYADNKNFKTVQSESELSRNTVQKLRNAKPNDGAATATKVAYYEQLAQANADTGDYKGATAAFESLQKISDIKLNYNQYAIAAMYYHKIGNDEQARRLLDEAAKVVPQTSTDVGITYDPKQIQESIANQKASYK